MKNSASTWISTVFLLLCSNGVEAEVPDRITPPQLLPGTKKIYRVELSINLIEGDTLIPKVFTLNPYGIFSWLFKID